MTLDYATPDQSTFRRLLREHLCEVEERPDGALMLRTRFIFPDGDGYPIHVLAAPGGEVRLSDRGHTLMHISYEHDIDALLEGRSRDLMDRVLGETGVAYDDGAFYLDTPPEQVPTAMFALGQAITRIYQIAECLVAGGR